MNKTLLEAAMQRLAREAEGVNFGEVSLKAEIRDGRITASSLRGKVGRWQRN